MANPFSRNRKRDFGLQGTTKYYRKRLGLLRHLQKTKLKISKTLAQAILEDETRGEREVLDDLIPEVTAEPVQNAMRRAKGKLLEGARSPNITTNSENRGSEYINDNTEHTLISKHKNDREGHSGDTHPWMKYKIPQMSNLEEVSLLELYKVFSNSAAWQISNLNVKPGDDHFLFWFMCSSYIPLICSCSGPLSNVFSLMAIICPWKINKENPNFEKDPAWVYSINALSSTFAVVSNLSLILNCRKKIRYTQGQVVSIYGWGIACLILTALIIGYHIWFYKFDYQIDYLIGEGFWFALVTVLLHFFNFSLLLLNDVGFLKKKYKPIFNIDHIQETLIIQTISMCVWLIIGAAVFSRVLRLHLGHSLYYCVMSVVTVGYQSEVSINNPLGQTLSAIWVIVALVLFGLIVNSIRKMIFAFSKYTLYWHRIERIRRRVLAAHTNNDIITTSNEDSYHLIENIHRWAFSLEGIIQLTNALVIFMGSLMLGGLGFSLLEKWPYKLSVYFCFFNLLTLGQGDQFPVSPGGEVLFCIWALSAIPVMTILVSTSSDFVFTKLTKLHDILILDAFVEFCLAHERLRKLGLFLKRKNVHKVDRKRILDMRLKSLVQTDQEKTYQMRNRTESTLNVLKNNNDGQVDSISDVPIMSHPADMLYNIILDVNGAGSYDFVTSPRFVETNTIAIQLANYFREGFYVKYDEEQQQNARDILAKNFQSLDSSFNVQRFREVYSLDDNKSPLPFTPIQKDHIVKTTFKKKKDYVLNKLSRMQVFLLELRKSLLDMCSGEEHRYTYQEWSNLLKITGNADMLNDNLYWIESRSPLSLPLDQPKYFTLQHMRHFELFLQQFAEEWDEMPVYTYGTDMNQ